MKIEKNIPLPSSVRKYSNKYELLHDLEVLDSVYFESRKECRAAYVILKDRNPDKAYATRMENDGQRLWRTK